MQTLSDYRLKEHLTYEEYKKSIEWLNGLRTGIRNAVSARYGNREELLVAFANNEIFSVRGLGQKGIAELREWLGLPAYSQGMEQEAAARKMARILVCIRFLKSEGYVITNAES